MARTAVLFTTHVINDWVKAHFLKLRDELPEGYELFLFYDEQKLTRRAVRKLAGDSALPHENDGWKRFKRPGRYFQEKIPGNEDGLLMNAMDRLPGYDWYWYIEYDMAFSGDWRTFFTAMEESNADLLAINVIRHDDTPNWPLWKSIEVPDGVNLPAAKWIRAHVAISRMSHRINEVLIPVYKQGWAGHAEGVFATLALQQGLSIEDIGGDGEFVLAGNANRFYRSTANSNTMGPGTIVFRPTRDEPGDEPNMLWHPVKKASRHDWDSESNLFFRLIGRIKRKLWL